MSGRRGARWIAGLSGAALLLLSACTPRPTPGTIDVIGDSVTMQSFWNRDDAWRAAGIGLPASADVVADAAVGRTFDELQPREDARVHDSSRPRPEILVMAVGTNNAMPIWGDPGWTDSDEASFRKLLDTPDPSTCVVASLPAAGVTAPQDVQDQLTLARTRMRSIASERPRTVIVDWSEVVAQHPEYLRADGIHLADDAAAPGQLANADAADAFAANLWAGVARCPH